MISLRLGVEVGLGEELRLVDLADGRLHAHWTVRGRPYGWLTFSPDGQWISARNQAEANFWNVASGQGSRRFPARFGMKYHHATEFTPDSRRLAIADGDETIAIVEVQTGEVVHPGADIEASLPHPRGRLVIPSSLWQTSCWFWDVATGQLLFSITDGAFHFSRDGHRLGCRRQNIGLVVWNVIEADAVRSLIGPANAVFDLDASPDARWLTAACDDGVRLWKLASGQEADFAPFTGARAVEFATDSGAVFAHGVSNTWRLPLQVKDRRFYHEMGFGEAPTVAADVRRLTSEIRNLKFEIRDSASRLASAATNAIAHLAAEVVLARRLRFTDTRTGEIVAEVAPPDGGEVRRVCFSRDGQRVMALADDGLIQVWDLPRLRTELAKLNLDWGSTNVFALPMPAPSPVTTSSAAPASARRENSPKPIFAP